MVYPYSGFEDSTSHTLPSSTLGVWFTSLPARAQGGAPQRRGKGGPEAPAKPRPSGRRVAPRSRVDACESGYAVLRRTTPVSSLIGCVECESVHVTAVGAIGIRRQLQSIYVQYDQVEG